MTEQRGRAFIFAVLLLVLGLGFELRGRGQDAKPPESNAQPPIPVGPMTIEKVFQSNEEYRPRAEAYMPIASGVEFLKNYPKKIRIEVFYGSWCGDSRDHMPSFLKIVSAANNPNIEVCIWAVDRAKREPADLVKSRRIVRVPTFIVFTDDKELGRIIERPTTTLEEDLYRILVDSAAGARA